VSPEPVVPRKRFAGWTSVTDMNPKSMWQVRSMKGVYSLRRYIEVSN
jgi:hypothetical protein